MQENQGQGFLEKEQLHNIWCGECKKAWNWRNKEVEEGRVKRVKCSTCGGKDMVIWKMEWNKKEKILCPPCRTGKKILWWNWGREVEWTVSRV